MAATIRRLSMFRFTIRDLLWLMVVVAVALCWWMDRSTVRFAWKRLANKDHELFVREQNFRRGVEGAGYKVLQAQRAQERLQEEVREKQLQIEQLLTAPSKSPAK